MSSSVGCESMLKSVGVSVEGETGVGVGNSLICVKLHVSSVKKELYQSPPPSPNRHPTDVSKWKYKIHTLRHWGRHSVSPAEVGGVGSSRWRVAAPPSLGMGTRGVSG